MTSSFSARGMLFGISCAFGLSCGSGAISVQEQGPICLTCSAPQSGQTTGNLAPTSCELSESASPIDAETTRSLGFGTALDLVERSFESPFAWTPNAPTDGKPASGYNPTTAVRVQTTVARIDHMVPSLAGCEDRVAITLHVSFATTDGAITVEGELVSSPQRDAKMAVGDGLLDLRNARGTIKLFPDAWTAPLTGYLYLSMGFWPGGVRGDAGVQLIEAGSEGSDEISYCYHPLEGRWPIDACDFSEWPMAPTEPDATPDGRSAMELRAALQSLLDAHPMTGTWNYLSEPSVIAQLGEPTNICKGTYYREGSYYVAYRTTLGITTGDGRVRISHDARAYVGFDLDHAVSDAFAEIYEESAVPAKDFPTSTGISGVDFGSLPAAIWEADLYFAQNGILGIRGCIFVEGVDTDGLVTSDLAQFSWQSPVLSWPGSPN